MGNAVHLGKTALGSEMKSAVFLFFVFLKNLLAFFQTDSVHIRCCGSGYLGFRPDGGSLSKSAKVTKALLPHHLAPRLGSVCPHSGIAPWAAAKGHPWPSAAIPASMPGCPLHNTCVRPAWLTGRRDQRPPRGGLIADLVLSESAFLLWERACSRKGRTIQHLQRL